VNTGRVYLVGGGPGDPGLLTVRGRQVLAQADVVVYDHLVSPRLLDGVPPAAERVYVGKEASAHTLCQDDINRLLVERARAGRTVVRLKGGDPYVFGRGGEEALALAEAGIPFEVVPGVTAGVGCAAYAGIPVTHRDIASAVAFVTGHESDATLRSSDASSLRSTSDKPDSALDWDALARWKGTLVFYMGVANLERICANLAAHGLAGDTPAAVIRWGTTARQQVVTATVATLPEAARAAGVRPPAITVVGEVVRLRDRLAWFEARPLFGRRIVVTRSRAQASDLSARLEALGAEVIEAPTIRIEPPLDPAPLREAVRDRASFAWILFTSASGVDAFFRTMGEEGLDARALAGIRIGAIGPATAARLAAGGVRADLEPSRFTGRQVVEDLAATADLRGAAILLPRADIPPNTMVEDLEARGARVRSVVAYRTVLDPAGGEEVLRRLREGGLDWLTFTSSSTVRNFLAAVPAEAVRAAAVRVASIGPVTSATARDLGLAVTVEADPHTVPDLVEAILRSA
jgi:uroporphyrinogen III methyltransferase/synthase